MPQGDIPGLRESMPLAPFAAVASGGANALLNVQNPFPWPVRIRNAWYIPTGASVANTESGSYRRLTLVNPGVSGTGTAIIASLNLSFTGASLVPIAMVVDTTQTMASGISPLGSQITIGAATANGTVLPAGQFAVSYEII